ncbi:MAG: 30S ribosomal protein S16 [Polyangiales bacterium]
MVKVRLARVGTKKVPVYRVVVTDARCKRDGRHLELLGTYNPRLGEGQGLTLNHARLAYWQGVGAQLSTEVSRLVKRNPAAAPTA